MATTIDSVLSTEVFNNSYNISDEPPTEFEPPETIYSLPVIIVLITFAITIAIVAVVGNALILAAFFTTPRLRRLTNYFYASLAITDLMAGLVVMPFMVSYTYLYYWSFGPDFCVFWLCTDMFVYSASVYHMCVICLDRFLAITFPFKYRLKRTKKLIIGFIAAAWLLALAFEVPATLVYKHIPNDSDLDYRIECDVEWMANVPVTLTSFLVTVFIPFLFTSILYGHIFVAIRRSHRYSVPEKTKTGKKSAGTEKIDGEKSTVKPHCPYMLTCLICLKSKRGRSSGKKENAYEVKVDTHGSMGVDRIDFDRNASHRIKHLCCCQSGQNDYDITSVVADETSDRTRQTVKMVGFTQNECYEPSFLDNNESSELHPRERENSVKIDDKKDIKEEGIPQLGDKHIIENAIGANTNNFVDTNDNTRKDSTSMYKECYINPVVSVETESSPEKTSSDLERERTKPTAADCSVLYDRNNGATNSTSSEGVTLKLENQNRFGSGKKGGMKKVSKSVINVLRIRQSVQNERQSQESILARRKVKEARAAATLGILLGIFLITWLPWKITTIADAFAQRYLFPDLWYEFAIWIQYSNSMINPFLYMFREKDFRIAVKHLLFRLLCRRKNEQSYKSSHNRATRRSVSNAPCNTSES